MGYNAAVESSATGRWYGRIIEFIGTHARADDKDTLLTRLKEELNYHIAWLQHHDDRAPRFRIIPIKIVEHVENVSKLGESGGEVATFSFDHQLISNEALKQIVQLMSYNRMDLLSLMKGLSPTQLKHIPLGKKRNIIDILSHICNAEEFYISRLGREADDLYEQKLGMSVDEADSLHIIERLSIVRDACIAVLTELVPQKNGILLKRSDYTNHPNETWTVYKILRRFLEHEREHIYNIRSYIDLPIRQL